MKIKKILAVICAMSIIAGVLSACGGQEFHKKVTSADFDYEQLDSSKYDVAKYTTPFWEGNIVYNEFVYPIMNEENILAPFELMYYADEIVSVRDHTLEHTYVEGIDYILSEGKLVVLPNGNIRVKMQEDIHQKSNPNNYPITYMYPHLDGEGFEYWNDQDIHNRMLVVTYIHNDKWDMIVPQSAADKLTKTMEKLENGEPLSIVFTGDSNAVGFNSSRIMATKPYADGYTIMAVKALREKYSGNIKFANTAVGGSNASFTEEQLEADILRYNPDLVVIAFGMNDAQMHTVQQYKDNINGRIEYIKRNLPDCEILLVTTMLANPWVFDAETYKEFASALYDVEQQWDGVGLCDPQALQLSLMETKGKEFLCFMGDNLVHPNDYGMRIIAQCVIAALSE